MPTRESLAQAAVTTPFIWVSNGNGESVTKLRAADGANKGTFAVGDYLLDLAFDGETIWVGDWLGGTVSKLRAADGTPWGTVACPSGPYRLAFDGVRAWATLPNSNAVHRM